VLCCVVLCCVVLCCVVLCCVVLCCVVLCCVVLCCVVLCCVYPKLGAHSGWPPATDFDGVREERPNHFIGTGLHCDKHVGTQGISVLFEESSRLVADVTGIVFHDEVLALGLGLLIVLLLLVLLVQLVQQGLICTLRETRFFVQQGQNTRRFSLFSNEVSNNIK